MRKYENLTDEDIAKFLENKEIREESLIREKERAEIHQKSDKELIDFIFEEGKKKQQIYDYRRFYAINEAIKRNIPITDYIFEQQIYEKAAILDKNIALESEYKKRKKLIANVRAIATVLLVLFLIIGIVYLLLSRASFLGIAIISNGIGIFITVNVVCTIIELLADIERNGRIQLLMQEKKDK